ncbi:MAG: hypothetical protein ABI556_03450 [Gemmatimonadales bacterium]
MSDVLTRLSTALETRYRVGRQIGIGGMARSAQSSASRLVRVILNGTQTLSEINGR